ncbi:MAG TPA: type II toxin-antitoxin system VapC family toxin [Blastocatellia bacterium]|nr:type II toxin-antitoxin system VapC family toxin [Blastocatellia bacterium]HMV83399.1 type II toxin-antitoxin system VapC family toxin [Blastocatellia bacterium]HMY74169.1 type II toxin-antitoxin system VapC family toxin [Blastocatellia bacterium]HMZ18573.1 type II toxin-antitoxin system VapC family toxin [Blastocatellia bacterium]HNG28126.1 type II toxin-antitoxin system VapC family toxin [Blastocatellia bacterium]
MSVVADTHAVIWYVDSPTDLTLAATSVMDAAANDSVQRIFLSAISLIEMQYLTEKGKIKPTVLPAVLAEIDNPQPILEVIPIDRRVFDFLGHIPRLTVPDMRDRIIAATALLLNLSLVTADTKIRALPNVVTVW